VKQTRRRQVLRMEEAAAAEENARSFLLFQQMEAEREEHPHTPRVKKQQKCRRGRKLRRRRL
jgi:hypothetical protein